MKSVLAFVVLATASSAPLVAHAQVNTDNFSREWQRCITYGERNNTVAIPESECNERELHEQDARLNQAYKMVMVRLPEQRKSGLRANERNWITARDRKCLSQEDDDRGECLIDETMDRIKYLEQYR